MCQACSGKFGIINHGGDGKKKSGKLLPTVAEEKDINHLVCTKQSDHIRFRSFTIDTLQNSVLFSTNTRNHVLGQS
jgi:hypothetical protein